MALVHWCERSDLVSAATSQLQLVEVILDIGCGIVPQNFIKPLVHICCEPYNEYVVHLQDKVDSFVHRDRSYIVLNMGWDDVIRFFPAKSVDSVFLVDVIEHLEKESALKLLARTEEIARNQVIVFTPLGFMPQHHEDGKDAWGMDGASWQEHRSGWLPEDFDDSWQIFAAKEFHTADNLSRPLERPFGAFWAIKTHEGCDSRLQENEETLLQNFEAGLKQKEWMLLQKEAEINSLILARIERKIRRMVKGMFSK